MNKKITVIGAGNVGATTAQRLFEKNYNEIALIDIAEDIAEGKALDILQSGPILGLDNNIVGSTNKIPVTIIKLTDDMKQSVQQDGQALFSIFGIGAGAKIASDTMQNNSISKQTNN